MAGEWLKFEKATFDKPEVLAIAAAIEQDPDYVIGKLLRMWSWFDTHTENGNARGVTCALLDSILRVTGFAENVAKVGWLTVKDDGIRLPNFDRHCGETAKSRSLTAKRVAGFKARKKKSNASTVTSALPREEKRREEEKQHQKKEQRAHTSAHASPLNRPDDVPYSTWRDWLALRKAKRAPVNETVISRARSESVKAGLSFGEFLAEWCERGSQGLKAEWLTEKRNGQRNSGTTAAAEVDLKRWYAERTGSAGVRVGADDSSLRDALDESSRHRAIVA